MPQPNARTSCFALHNYKIFALDFFISKVIGFGFTLEKKVLEVEEDLEATKINLRTTRELWIQYYKTSSVL